MSGVPPPPLTAAFFSASKDRLITQKGYRDRTVAAAATKPADQREEGEEEDKLEIDFWGKFSFCTIAGPASSVGISPIHLSFRSSSASSCCFPGERKTLNGSN